MKYEEAVEYIDNIPKFTKKNTLAHTRDFLEKLGISRKENNAKIIHVAGTNGKGTVCAIMSNVLINCGRKTGLFISPHLVKINERICINNEEISDKEFEEAFNAVKNVVDIMEKDNYPHPSYFEFLFLMAMWKFNKENVEYIVLETGLGGRLDATNSVIKPYLTIITSIGMDHMEYLGNTIEDIAREKAGIIKKCVPVIYWGEDEKVSNVISDIADKMQAKTVKVVSKDYKIIKKTNKSVDFSIVSEYYLNDTFSVPFISEYQVQNATVALKAIECMPEIRNMKENVKTGLFSVHWEGRMEMIMPGVILDGAHNGPGIDEFIKTFNEFECQGEKNILFSVVRDKDYEYMVSKLADTEVKNVYITHIDSDRGLETEEICEDFKKYGCNAKIYVNEDVNKAFCRAVNDKKEEDVLFCVGSLYLVGEIKKSMPDLKKHNVLT